MLQIFCDFDGTITSKDSIVFLTERFGAGHRYRDQILKEIKSKEITVFEAVRRELLTVKVSWEEAAAALRENIVVDPHFPAFVEWCRRRGIPLSVVSSGLEPVLQLFLKDIDVRFHAHPVEMNCNGWSYRRRDSSDKFNILRRASQQSRIVYVGDGASDVPVLELVDVLFATDYLAQHCRENTIPFLPFESFADVQNTMYEEVFNGQTT